MIRKSFNISRSSNSNPTLLRSEQEGKQSVSISAASSLDSFIMSLPDDFQFTKSLVRDVESPSCADGLEQQSIIDVARQQHQHGMQSIVSLLPTNNSESSASSNGGLETSACSHGAVPEFMYQLTRMLSDDNANSIEWNNGSCVIGLSTRGTIYACYLTWLASHPRTAYLKPKQLYLGKIEVHNPHRLEQEVLHKYFRHSKFASLQRQLNYFGFRKVAGKGKMSPCSYVNESAKGDLKSLLFIKRKYSVKVAKGKGSDKKKHQNNQAPQIPLPKDDTPQIVNPVLAGILQRNASNLPQAHSSAESIQSGSYHALAQSAVGRGIRHGYSSSSFTKISSASSVAEASTYDANYFLDPPSSSDSLSELASNYRSSIGNALLLGVAEPTPLDEMQHLAAREDHLPKLGFLSRNSSLVDLAMIPGIDDDDGDGLPSTDTSKTYGMSFVDFPNQVHLKE
jgi:hypothetical protein